MGSDCSGKCEDCCFQFANGGCLAGHGDDHFVKLTLDIADRSIKSGRITEQTKEKLLKKFPELKQVK